MCKDCEVAKSYTAIGEVAPEAQPYVPTYRISIDVLFNGDPAEAYTKGHEMINGLPKGLTIRRFNVESW